MGWWTGGLVAAALCVGCTEPGVGPPAVIRSVTAPTFDAVAGSGITGGVTVRVVDWRGKAVAGSKVAFTITSGDGTVAPPLVISDADGRAHADWTIGQTAGANTLLASIDGVDSTTTFTATGVSGPAAAVVVTPHILRLPAGTSSATVAGTIVDQYQNAISGNATFTSRNPGLVTVNAATGAVTVVGSGTTYIVATGGTFSDSTLVVVLKSTDSPCTGLPAHSHLAVGEVMTTGFSDNGICVDATSTGGEYAFVPYFNSPLPNAATSFTLSGFGIKTPGALTSPRPVGAQPGVQVSTAFEGMLFHDRLRRAEAEHMPLAARNARLWYADRPQSALRSATVPVVGHQMQINVEPDSFCSRPVMRTGRVAAVTQRAVVVADLANPAGFTDAEYQSFGVSFDTLVYPLDVTTFGSPTDIDGNGGRIVLFFTHAVNEGGDNRIGFFYSRDLLPKGGPLGVCPGSNASEIMYLLVPDAQYDKSYVLRNTVATSAHEFQHLINASRRLYVNTTAAPSEEVWLNEGLSHVAEELMFYRVSGLKPRQNLGLEVFGTQYSLTFQSYQFQNFSRFKEYLRAPGSRSPIGSNDAVVGAATRGAIWSFLRYAADQRFSDDEPSLWFKLVNSNLTGLNNLYEVIGPDARLMMRDWTLGVFLDDLVTGMNPRYQQPSWNLRTAMATVGGYSVSALSLPATGAQTIFSLSAGGTAFVRFGVSANQEAFVSAAGLGGAALPKNLLLALVRTK